MALISYRDWLAIHGESSAFTRRRHAAALGLAPDIPDASIHSRSTASPFETEKLCKKKKKKKKSLKESEKVPVKSGVDEFLKNVEALKGDVDKLKDEDEKSKRKKKKCPPKADSPKDNGFPRRDKSAGK